MLMTKETCVMLWFPEAFTLQSRNKDAVSFITVRMH